MKRVSRAVCILGSVAPLSNESVVPQSPADLSDDDRQMLSGLGLPPDKWDNLNALLAMYRRTENYDVFSVHVSKPGMELNCSIVLQQIEYLLMTSLNKEGGKIVMSHVCFYIACFPLFNSCNPLLWQWQEEHWGLVLQRWLHHLQRYC